MGVAHPARSSTTIELANLFRAVRRQLVTDMSSLPCRSTLPARKLGRNLLRGNVDLHARAEQRRARREKPARTRRRLKPPARLRLTAPLSGGQDGRAALPVLGGLLEGVGELQDAEVVAVAADDLHAD